VGGKSDHLIFKKSPLVSLTPPFPRPLFLARGGFFGVKKLEKEEVLREGGESLREMRE
jgi:hypothetical protein